MHKLFLACIAVFLSGCLTKVNLNMGESDYRIAIKDSFIAKYERDETLPTRLINSGESLSVHLKQVFIDNYSERFERIVASVLATKIRGEIAIVARVFELGQGEILDFRESATKKLGRLIYYTEDVRTGGHLLNQSMPPIYGPITYQGNPLVIQITILELDIGESQQIKALLSTLADLGGKAWAPASPILKSLDALGEQLLSGEQDDIELSYLFVLHPTGGRHESAPYSPLATGDYIIMRQEPNKSIIGKGGTERFDQMPWGKTFRYCPTHGRLFKWKCKCDDVNKGEGSSTCEYRDKTYLVVQVNSGFSPLKLDVTQKFTEFQEEMEKEVDYSDFETKLTTALAEFAKNVKQADERQKIEKLLSKAMDSLKIACDSNDVKVAKHYIQELYDVVVNKTGMPMIDETTAADFSDSQWSRLLFAMSKAAVDAFKVKRTDVESSADANALAGILECLPTGS